MHSTAVHDVWQVMQHRAHRRKTKPGKYNTRKHDCRPTEDVKDSIIQKEQQGTLVLHNHRGMHKAQENQPPSHACSHPLSD